MREVGVFAMRDIEGNALPPQPMYVMVGTSERMPSVIETADGRWLQQAGTFAVRTEEGAPFMPQPMYIITDKPKETEEPAQLSEDSEHQDKIDEEIAPEDLCRFLADMFKEYLYAGKKGAMD